MKKFLFLMIGLLMLSACSGTEEGQDSPPISQEQSQDLGQADEGGTGNSEAPRQPQAPNLTDPEDMPVQMPEDFEFIVSRAFLSYSSLDHLYYYDLSWEDRADYMVDLYLKAEDKERIWTILQKLNIHRFHSKYTEHYVEPPLGGDLYVIYDNRYYSIEVTDRSISEYYPEMKEYFTAIDEIMTILETYPETEKLGEFPYRIL